jgi:integrase/recombinase XerD
MSRTFTASWESLVRGKDSNLSDVIESFLLAKEAEGRSKRTLQDYQSYLREFDRVIGAPTLARLTPEVVTRYVAERRRSSPAAARYAAAILKSFGTWLAEMKYLATPMGGSVLATVKAPRVDRPRNPYTDQEVRTMIRVLGASTLRTRARDSAAILTLLGSGLRLNELRELRLPNVHIARPIEESYVLVAAETSKSRSTRKVRLDPMAAEAIHKYIKDWRPDRAPDGPLLLTEEGKPFSLFGFKNYMARLGDRFEEAGIANWMAHRSRHYWATSAHRAGMTVFDIAVEGGWRDLKMVQRYTKSRPFEELQRLPTPLSFVLQKRAS